MSVPAIARFTRAARCPICDGYDRLPRGEGVRCYGFLSSDGEYAHCSRADHAGSLELTPGSSTYAHRLQGPCRCGQTHGTSGRPDLYLVNDAPAAGARAPITATYDYCDETGALLFQVVRRADKSFTQRRRDGASPDGWCWKLGDTRRVLYRLPDLLAADPHRMVIIAEGEKDVDRAIALGLLATCNPHGAGKWRPEFNEHLRGRHVVVIADVDENQTGQTHAHAVVTALSGIAASTLYLELPQHDLSEWADAGGTVDALKALVKEARDAEIASLPQFAAHSLKDLLAKTFPPVVWAVPDLIPQGLTLFAGNPKSGKSLLMLQIGLGIAAGGFVLGQIPVSRGEVLYCDFENGEEILQERVRAAVRGTVPDGFFYVTIAPTLADGLLGLIESWKRAHPHTRLIILDTFEAVRPPPTGKNLNAYREDYAALRPLADLAKRLRVAIVVVHHLSKASGTVDDIFSHFSGSYGLNASVDNLMAIGQEGTGTVLAAKGRRGAPSKKLLTWDGVTGQWTDSGDPAEARQSETRRLILDALRDANGPLYPSEIAGVTGLKPDVVRQRLFHMTRHGDVQVSGNRYSTTITTSRTTYNTRNAPEENGVTGNENGRTVWPPGLGVTLPTRGNTTAITGVTSSRYAADESVPDADPWLEGGDPDDF